MKLVMISDTHAMHDRIDVPDGDVLIHAGDFSSKGNLKEFKEFIGWLDEQPHEYKIFTCGNHDLSVEQNIEHCRSLIPTGINMLLDEEITIEGIKFYGAPWTPQFFNWSFMSEREDMHHHWAKIPENADVVITHGPPYGHGDPGHYVSHQFDQYPPPKPKSTQSIRKVGCLALLHRLIVVKPIVHISGHLHGGYGITGSDIPELRNTTFVNASTCNDSYKPIQKPLTITI